MKMSTEGLAATTLAEAFALAEGESGLGEPDVSEPDLPSVEDEAGTQAPPAEGDPEQPDDAGDSEIASLLDSLEDGEEAPAANTVDLNSDEFWNVVVPVDTVEGRQEVSIEELRAGYMKDADYRHKTQELATQRKSAQEAIDFYDAFSQNPIEFATFLATRAGLIEEGATPVRQIDVAEIRTEEQIEAEVTRRLEERLQEDPRVKQAEEVAARQQVDSAFDAIEAKYSTKLTDEHRRRIASEAVKRGTTDLELVFEAMLSRARRQSSQRGDLKSVAPTRPGANKGAPADSKPRVPQSVREAAEMAIAELSAV